MLAFLYGKFRIYKTKRRCCLHFPISYSNKIAYSFPLSLIKLKTFLYIVVAAIEHLLAALLYYFWITMLRGLWFLLFKPTRVH